MDYDGQRLAEMLYYWIIIAFGAVGWIWGYFEKDFKYTLYSWGVGVCISVVLCVPDWPWFNNNPQKWRESAEGEGEPPNDADKDEKKKKKEKKKTK
mmetsp:Transcript_13423/g.28351  ORF Transcript_13423/g.28351 Transcript_13423/m.28351 type:complete len:96 (+) Transcript_13423:101-388(+)